MDNAEFAARLAPVVRRCVTDFEELLGCERLTGGASQETWQLRVRAAGVENKLALRRAPVAQSAQNSVATLGLEVEAKLMRAAHAAGIPEPEVLTELEPTDGLGEGIVMEWLEGETLGGRIVHSDALAAVRPQLARSCGEVLAGIHQLDVAAIGLAQQLQEYTPSRLVELSWQEYQELNTPQPMIDYSARWLLENLPQQYTTGLVHGDFRNGNLMICPQRGITAVLDWELAHLGDPVRDLGWLCTNSWRFGNTGLPVGGFGNIDDLLRGYESASGCRVDPAHLRFWMVFGSFWWSVCCLRMAQSWRGGEETSLERPAIGRRSSEGQMDCVNLVIPGAFTTASADEDGQEQLPSTTELIASIEAFMRGEIIAASAGRTRFLTRVGANSLAIVGRELGLGPALQQAEQERLRQLLGLSAELPTMRWQLVEQLRDGTLALHSAGLAAHLRETVAGQLQIDQPEYSALR